MRPSACVSAMVWFALLTICAQFKVQAASADRYPHLVAVFNSVFAPDVDKQPLSIPTAIEPISSNTIRGGSKCLTGCGNKIRLVNTAISDADHNSVLKDEIAIDEDLLNRYDVANQLTALRIEYIKRQILKKLRMTEIPSVSATDLPQIVETNSVHNGYNYNEDTDDFYGKTTKVIIFPYEDKARCVRKIRSPSACVPFQLPNDIHPNDVSSAQLWFYKKSDILDSHNQTFIISEVAHWDSNRSFQKTKPIAIQETNIKQGWLKIDVAYVVRNWLTHEESGTHAINLACKTCAMSISESPISFTSNYKPYLVIYTTHEGATSAPKPLPLPATSVVSLQSLLPAHSFSHRRRKRSTICAPGATECCREHLYVSFAEIGWDNWIMEPAGYNAYFCKGTCSTAAAVTISASQHNSIIQALMQQRNDKKATLELELTPCCAATQFQPLQLLYTNGNKTITSKILPNMIVTQCGYTRIILEISLNNATFLIDLIEAIGNLQKSRASSC